MKRSELIAKLYEMGDDDPNVAIFDWRKNLHNDSGGGCSAGIEANFNIELMKAEDIPEETLPWIALSFENDDYNEDGTLAEK